MAYEGQLTEMVKFQGHKDDRGDAYYARPTRSGRFPGMVVIHHLPGWDEWIIEVTRKFAHYGYAAIAPHLYFRDGPGSPDDIGAKVRAAGGVADLQVVGDVAGCVKYLRAQPHARRVRMHVHVGGPEQLDRLAQSFGRLLALSAHLCHARF